MIKISYPQPQFRFKKEDGVEFIFDAIRKLWVRLTPEEWVRQNFISYLIEVQQYPASLMAIEKEIKLGELKLRCDIVVYKQHKPWMIVECKEMNVPLSAHVLKQVLDYNMVLAADFVAITNGTNNYLWQLIDGKAVEQFSFPAISALL